MDSRQATVRNVRSKCRCSSVLQFTFRHAVSCVLHRPPSQVIHCIVFYFQFQRQKVSVQIIKHNFGSHIPTRGKGTETLARKPWVLKAKANQPSEGALTAQTAVKVVTQEADEPSCTRDEKYSSPRSLLLYSTRTVTNCNDPSAGSPTETLLRLLLPLNAQVWESSRASLEA